MARYDYICYQCQDVWEENREIDVPHPTQCPMCGSADIDRWWESPSVFRDRKQIKPWIIYEREK